MGERSSNGIPVHSRRREPAWPWLTSVLLLLLACCLSFAFADETAPPAEPAPASAVADAVSAGTNSAPGAIIITNDSSKSALAQRSPAEIAFLKRLEADQQYKLQALKARDQAQKQLEAVHDTLRLAEATHLKITIEDTPPPPKVLFVDKYRDELALGLALVLLGWVTILALRRHQEEAELRKLAGGYLSDGTEIAKFKLPELFAKPPTEVVEHWTERRHSEEVLQTPDPLAPFWEQAPANISAVFDVLKDLESLTNADERQQVLLKAKELVSVLVQKTAGNWALRPAWQVSYSLQLLIGRAAEKPKDATQSVVRTIHCGLDALREVCVPGIRPNLLMDPPLRILAVDDDALCRRAVAVALDKAGLAPEFAENGAIAVDLASKNPYDIIFMDIQMPEMDGLTACEKIREFETHKATPIVFVTIQSDFQTRVQSTAKGGTDFIAKPFLVFELTVKAVVSSVRKRIALLSRVSTPLASPISAPVLSAHTAAAAPVLARPTTSTSSSAVEEPAAPQTAPEKARNEIENRPWDDKAEFFTEAPRFLATTREMLDAINSTTPEDVRQKTVDTVYLRVHAAADKIKSRNLSAATRVSSSIEALVKRLHQNSKSVSISTLNTTAHGLRVLEQICAPGIEQQLANHPKAKILVVDDEPLARRAVVGALQLAFEKPDSASQGGAALLLAAQNQYDVIFSDIEMPEMSGFELCRQLREDGLNSSTPVVFITSHTDFESRAEARESGGTDFIGKPFLPIEITVKALTFVYEGRLGREVSAVAA